jgi:Clostripain family
MATKAAKTAKAAKRKWTVLVYLAGDNNLDSAGVVDLAEMKKVGSGSDLAIVAQFDRSGARGETRRYFLQKGTNLAKDVVATLGETNMGDPDVLEGFLRWGAKTYPAHNYMVVIWNHGAGWDDTDIYRSARKSLGRNFTYKGQNVVRGRSAAGSISPLATVRAIARRPIRRAVFASTIHAAVKTRAIAFDDNAKDFLDNVEMKRVLARASQFLGGKIAVVGMDACLMSMVEVAYQIRDTATVMVGSQEVEPGEGWPYDTILRALAAKPAMSAADLGRTIVSRYLASYSASAGVTQTALDLPRVESLVKAIDGLAVALTKGLSNPAVLMALVRARNSVQSYDTKDYIDLVDYCRLVKKQTTDSAIGTACSEVEKLGVDPLVLAAGYKGDAMKDSHGVSIYFPQGEVSDLYAKLDFAKKCRWPAFLDKYRAALQP